VESRRLDVVVANERGPLLIYKNTVTPENSGLNLSWKERRATAAPSAAQVTLFLEWPTSGSAVPGAQARLAKSTPQHFGLGKFPPSRKSHHPLPLAKPNDR